MFLYGSGAAKLRRSMLRPYAEEVERWLWGALRRCPPKTAASTRAENLRATPSTGHESRVTKHGARKL